MLSVNKCAVPPDTFLHRYGANGAYADCYWTEVPEEVALPEFIFAFYTTALFKLERFILSWAVAKPSTDQQVRELADCQREDFAAWTVENRNERELMMCDDQRRTRSWLSVVPVDGRMHLYFGSAVVPRRNSKDGKSSLGFVFQVLLGFHRMYSVLLLYSARSRLKA
jgi:hypothetical protein